MTKRADHESIDIATISSPCRCPHDCIDEEDVPLIKATFLFLYSSGDGRLSLINGEGAAMVGVLCLETENEEAGRN